MYSTVKPSLRQPPLGQLYLTFLERWLQCFSAMLVLFELGRLAGLVRWLSYRVTALDKVHCNKRLSYSTYVRTVCVYYLRIVQCFLTVIFMSFLFMMVCCAPAVGSFTCVCMMHVCRDASPLGTNGRGGPLPRSQHNAPLRCGPWSRGSAQTTVPRAAPPSTYGGRGRGTRRQVIHKYMYMHMHTKT